MCRASSRKFEISDLKFEIAISEISDLKFEISDLKFEFGAASFFLRFEELAHDLGGGDGGPAGADGVDDQAVHGAGHGGGPAGDDDDAIAGGGIFLFLNEVVRGVEDLGKVVHDGQGVGGDAVMQ